MGLGLSYGFSNLDELVAERKKEQLLKEAVQRQVQQQQFANSMQEQQLSLHNRQLDQQAQERQAAQSSLDTNRQFAQGANISEHSMPGDVFDQPTADLLRKVGQGGMIRTTAAQPAGHLTNADDQGPVDAVPEQNISRGGSGYLRAKMAQDEINARSAATLAETSGRNKTLQSEADARNAEIARHNKEMEGIGRTNASAKTGAGVGALEPGALDKQAQFLHDTGTMPNLGMGAAALPLRKAIMDREAQMYPTDSIALGKASFGADSNSLKKMQGMQDALQAFEGTADRNIGIMQDVLKTLPDTGVAFLNSPWRAFRQGVGNTSVPQFNVVRQSLATEYARIINNPNLTGVLTNEARRDIEQGLSDNATGAQLMSALETFQREASNRRMQNDSQLRTIRGRIPGMAGAAADTQQAPAGTRTKYRGSITLEQ